MNPINPILTHNNNYEAPTLSISNQKLPIEIVQKIALYMLTGTMIHFKRVSKACYKATELAVLDENIINKAKLFFNLFDKIVDFIYKSKVFFHPSDMISRDIEKVCGLEFAILHAFCSLDKAKVDADQIFSKYPNVNSVSQDLIHIYLASFYGILGLEYFQQNDFTKAEAAFRESVRAGPNVGRNACMLGKALLAHYSRLKELKQCERINSIAPLR